MTKYRKILRLRNLGLSQNDIATSCLVSKKTVNRVLKLAKEHNLNWLLEERLTDKEIDKIIHPNGNEARKITDRKLPDYERIKNELHRNGVNKKLFLAEHLHHGSDRKREDIHGLRIRLRSLQAVLHNPFRSSARPAD